MNATSNNDFLRKFNEAYKKQNYSAALKLITRLAEDHPDDHWYWTRLSSICYELRNYSDALQASEIAYGLEPDCPLVIWDYATALYGNEQWVPALEKYSSIISRGEDSIAYGECGEGVGWARSVINDSKYMIATILHELGATKEAISYIEDHLQNRRKGQFSCYPLREVRKKRNSWIKG